MDKLTALKTYFGHSAFRPGQEKMVDALLAGRDALGVMPTGAGKSVCYQLPAMLLPGVTIVVSPLISLMQDQVAALEQSGLPAACINSTQSLEEQMEALNGTRLGYYKILYVAPERLLARGFSAACRKMDISLVVVDEAHCVSQWGQDFRPGYLDIAAFVRQLPRRPAVGAFTATATQQVKEDILRLLALQNPLQVTTGFNRPNLYFEVARPPGKDAYLMEQLGKRRDQSGIVYCSTRRNVESVYELLQAAGLPVARYHAGLPDWERRENQQDFIHDRARIMVATNAFGMGIDKSNVNYVIHYNMPLDLESYYQEAGRAGRDGSPADCILLYSAEDVNIARFLLEHSEDNERLTALERFQVNRRDKQRLAWMVDYCKTSSCLRSFMLSYFGETEMPLCENCGNCLGDYNEVDITVQAQKILSCVVRAERHLGCQPGRSRCVQILRGSRDSQLLEQRLDTLSTYGILDEPEQQIYAYLAVLEAQGYLSAAQGELALTSAAWQVLRGRARVMMRQRRVRLLRKKAAGPVDPALYEVLRQLRMGLARQAGVPGYAVFSDAALREISATRPRSEEEFLQISGVGEAKLRRYGAAFLKAIEEYTKK